MTRLAIFAVRGERAGARKRRQRKIAIAVWAANTSNIHQRKYWATYSLDSAGLDSKMMNSTLCENSCP